MLLSDSGTDPLRRILLGAVLVAVCWYLGRIAVALALLAVSRSRPGLSTWAIRCAPEALRPLVRRAVAGGLLGVALAGSTAWADTGPACPEPARDIPVLDRAERCVSDPLEPAGGLPSAAPAKAAHPQADRAPATTAYTVEPGDSLWRISADLLGPGADAGDVAALWPGIYAANRDAIGPDPSIIMPGTELVVPADAAAAGAVR